MQGRGKESTLIKDSEMNLCTFRNISTSIVLVPPSNLFVFDTWGYFIFSNERKYNM